VLRPAALLVPRKRGYKQAAPIPPLVLPTSVDPSPPKQNCGARTPGPSLASALQMLHSPSSLSTRTGNAPAHLLPHPRCSHPRLTCNTCARARTVHVSVGAHVRVCACVRGICVSAHSRMVDVCVCARIVRICACRARVWSSSARAHRLGIDEAPPKSHRIASPSLQEHIRHHTARVVSAVIHVDCVANVYAVIQCAWA
jgi:hypothetical protein